MKPLIFVAGFAHIMTFVCAWTISFSSVLHIIQSHHALTATALLLYFFVCFSIGSFTNEIMEILWGDIKETDYGLISALVTIAIFITLFTCTL